MFNFFRNFMGEEPKPQAAVVDVTMHGDSEAPSTSAPSPSPPSARKSLKRQEYLAWDEYFMGVALLTAQRSKDPATQVGAVICDAENVIQGVGYNGMPRNCDDDEMPWGKGSQDPLENKHLFVCHAELNAVVNSHSVRGCTIYVTLFPCNQCAKLIIQAGVKRVVYLRDTPQKVEMQASKIMFEKAGIQYDQYVGTKETVTLTFK